MMETGGVSGEDAKSLNGEWRIRRIYRRMTTRETSSHVV